jgi:hypothetical protein
MFRLLMAKQSRSVYNLQNLGDEVLLGSGSNAGRHIPRMPRSLLWSAQRCSGLACAMARGVCELLNFPLSKRVQHVASPWHLPATYLSHPVNAAAIFTNLMPSKAAQ